MPPIESERPLYKPGNPSVYKILFHVPNVPLYSLLESGLISAPYLTLDISNGKRKSKEVTPAAMPVPML
jgi:hypothetical protein